MTIQEAIAELVEALTMGVRALQEKDRRVRATARATREGHTGRRPKWTHGDRERVKAARIQGLTHAVIAVIAAETGIPKGTIKKILRTP